MPKRSAWGWAASGLLAAVALTIAVVQGVAVTHRAEAASAPTQLPQGFLDVSSGDYVRAQLDPKDSLAGSFVVAIPGVGLVWASGPGKVTVDSQNSTHLTYDGAGAKDPTATLDPEFGIRYRQQGPPQEVKLRVIGQFDPPHKTASVEVWIDGQHTHIGALGSAATPSATDAASTYLRLLKAGDWAGLYALLDDDSRKGVSAAEFAQGMAGAAEAQGITSTSADAPAVSTNDAGVTYARVAIHLTYASKPPTSATLTLIMSSSGWKVFTVK